MKKILFLTVAALVGWVGVSWAGAPPVPEIPAGAAPLVVAGATALIFAAKSYFSKK